MKAPELEKKRQLVTVLKNGMAIFTEASKGELSIYCQNVLTEEVFLLNKSLKIPMVKPKPRVSAVCSYDGITIKVLVKFKNSPEATLFCVTVNDRKVSESVDTKKVSIAKDLVPVDNSGSGGLFHFICGYDSGRGIIDIDSQSAQPHYFVEHNEPTHGFQNMNLYALADGIICIGHYHQHNTSRTPFFKSLLGIDFGSSYLKLYDTKEFECLHQIKINGTVHVVAVSPNRQFLAMSIENGRYFGKPLENQKVNKFLCPIEIWDLSQTPKKIRTIRYDAEVEARRLGDSYRQSSILSMSLSDEGNLAFVVSKHGRAEIYYYSFSENKVWNTPLDNIRFEREYFHPSYFFDGDHFLFADMNSFFVCKIDHVGCGWVLEKCIDVNNIQLTMPRKAKSKSAVSPLASKNKTQRDKLSSNPEFFTITRGYPTVDNEKNSPGQVVQALSPRRPVLSPRETPVATVLREEPGLVEYEKIKKEKEPIAGSTLHVIYKATWSGQIIALKVLKVSAGSEANRKQLEGEFNKLKSIDCPQVIKTYGFSYDREQNYCLMLHYYPHGNLGEYVYNPKEGHPKNWIYRCAVEVCEALDYLHSRRWVHKDIKPENVFLDENWHAVLGDFGLSNILPDNSTHQSTDSGGRGTYAFMAPELLQIPVDGQRNAYRTSCDIYSLAIFLWCCEVQKMPFEKLNSGQIAVHVTKGERAKIPPDTSPKLAALIQSCWAQEPPKRPVISEVFKKMTDIYKEELQNSGGVVSAQRSSRK